MLVNLVGNAVKFTAKGYVRLTVMSKGSGVIQFAVSDTGIGISPEKLASVFDAFIQADGSHTRQFGGTGLGLTISRRLVSLMGGKIQSKVSWAQVAVSIANCHSNSDPTYHLLKQRSPSCCPSQF